MGFVEGQRLNQVGVPFEDLAHLSGYLAIARKVGGQECCVGAKTFGSKSGHRGTHAELSRFIRSSTHYGAIPTPSDNNGFAAQLRIVALLHGRIKRVHVDRTYQCVKISYRWTLARPGARFTIQVDQVQQNVPVED